MTTGNPSMSNTTPTPMWRRLAGPAILLALLAAGYAGGLHHYLSLEAIARNRSLLGDYVVQHRVLAILAFMAVYMLAVAASFPGATILTILSGLLFGWLVGGVTSVLSATLGAAIVFQIAKSSFGDVLSRKAGPALSRISEGFKNDAFNYLLFLRLVPAFPFWLVNIAPALANVKLRSFVAATALGIIPGTFAFASVGAGLDSIIAAEKEKHAACLATGTAADCPFELSLSSLVTPQLLLAFAALGVVALIPVALKKWKARHAV